MFGVPEGRIARSSSTKKVRHNKVYTSKGVRDRRVRLSADTAIQFYDVQDRLGFDRATEAVDWLIHKAKASIDKLFDSSNSQQIHHLTTSHTCLDGSSELPYIENCSTWYNATVDFAATDPYYQKILEMDQNQNQKSCDMFSSELSSGGERFTWNFNSVPNENDDLSRSGKVPLFQR